jgi:hypothetical protein
MESKSSTIGEAHLNSFNLKFEKLHPRIICHNGENDHFLECWFGTYIYNVKIFNKVVYEFHLQHQSTRSNSLRCT